MASNDFLINEVKDRIIKGLQSEYLGYVANKEELDEENKQATIYFQDTTKLNEVADILIENAKLQCQNSGKIPGNKEVLGIVTNEKARSAAINYWKSNK